MRWAIRGLVWALAAGALASCRSAPTPPLPSFAHEAEERYRRLSFERIFDLEVGEPWPNIDTSELTAGLPFDRIGFEVSNAVAGPPWRVDLYRSGRIVPRGDIGPGTFEDGIPLWWYARLCSLLETIDATQMPADYSTFGSHSTIFSYELEHDGSVKSIRGSGDMLPAGLLAFNALLMELLEVFDWFDPWS